MKKAQNKFRIIVEALEEEGPIFLYGFKVKADCSVEALSKAGRLLCARNHWKALAKSYFSDGYASPRSVH